MKRMKNVFLFLMVLGLAACDSYVDNGQKGRIRLNTVIEPLSRIHMDNEGRGNFTQGDVLWLSLSNSVMQTIGREFVVNQTEMFWTELNLPQTVQQVNFSGCYPVPSQTEGDSFVFDVASASNQDLLLAPAVSVDKNSAAPVNLSFSHALHRLKITYVPTSDYGLENLQFVATQCTAKSACKVNLASGVIAETLAQTHVFGTSGSEVVFLLPPQNTSDVNLKITVSGRSVEFNLEDWLQDAGFAQSALQGGHEMELKLSVSRDGISFGSMNIVGWETQGSVEGDIIV